MSFQIFFKRGLAACAGLLIVAFAAVAQTPTLIVQGPKELRIAERNNLYCAGFVQTSPIDTKNRIVGAVDEQDGFLFSENEVMYINMGSDKDVKVGDIFSVVRPKGKVKTPWTKKGSLGFYVQEVGALEVVRVKEKVSAVRVKTSCDNLLLGDLVQPVPERSSPFHRERPALDLFADPSGKRVGRLFMARDGVNLIGRENVVYIDLGAEDSVEVGDFLTVFRPLGKGNLLDYVQSESTSTRNAGFQSDKYMGGELSNQTARVTGDTADGKALTTEKARGGRPEIRKVVGEMVILNVKERTATAVVTRTVQEIQPGDWVEVQ